MATRLSGMITYLMCSCPQSHMTFWSRGLTRSSDKPKPLYLNYHSGLAPKLGRLVTNLKGLLQIITINTLVTWSCKITCQTKTIISPLPQNPCGHNTSQDGDLPWADTKQKVTWPYNRMVLWDHMTN